MAVYYIAAVSSGGSNSNSGTSFSSPWTISKLNTFENAGDLILINKGDFIGINVNITRSGTISNPITYDIYGASANNPILDGSASATPVFTISGNYVNVKNIQFQNTTGSNGAVFINSTHDVSVYNCVMNNAIRGIRIANCGSAGVLNVKVLNSYFYLISDVNNGSGGFTSGGGCYVQYDTCTGSGAEVAYNKGYTDVSTSHPFVGDLLSFFKLFGTSSSYALIHDNQLRGGSSDLASGGKCGIGLGDNGGQYQNVYNNILINAAEKQLCFMINIVFTSKSEVF